MSRFQGLLRDNSHRVRGIIAADVKKRVDFVRAEETMKISWQYFRSGLSRVEPSAAAGDRGHRLEIGGRLLAQIDEILMDDSAHAVERAVDVGDGGKSPRLQRSCRPATD